MTYRLAKLSRERVRARASCTCRPSRFTPAASAKGCWPPLRTMKRGEKLLAAPIAGMELEMMIRGTRAALEACLA